MVDFGTGGVIRFGNGRASFINSKKRVIFLNQRNWESNVLVGVCTF